MKELDTTIHQIVEVIEQKIIFIDDSITLSKLSYIQNIY